MKKFHESPVFWIILVSFFSIAVLMPSVSATSEEEMNATLMQPVLSENITGQSHDFHFFGDTILWMDSGLYLYSLKDNSTRLIAPDTAPGGWIYGSAVSDRYVIWHQYPGTLHLHDISSGKERTIPDAAAKGAEKTYSKGSENETARWMPFVYGDRVVWLQGFSSATYGNSDIFMLNLTTNEVIPVNESLSAKGGLAMNGDHIVWYSYNEKRDGTETSIYLYDLSTGKETVVWSDPGFQSQTTLSEKYIAWTDSHNPLSIPRPLSQIHIYTISDGTTRAIPATTMNQYDPILAGDYVIYTECTPHEKSDGKRTCNSKIYDIVTGTVLEFSPLRTERNINTDYEYDRKIHGFSRGEFLIEEIKDGKRVFGLYRIGKLRLDSQPTSLAEDPVVAGGNLTVRNPADPLPPTQPSPGFDVVSIVSAFIIITMIIYGRKQ